MEVCLAKGYLFFLYKSSQGIITSRAKPQLDPATVYRPNPHWILGPQYIFSIEPINILISLLPRSCPLQKISTMENADANSEVENDAEMKLLRDKFRLSAISIIESQGAIFLLLLPLVNFTFSILTKFKFLILVYGNAITQQNKTAWKYQKSQSLALRIWPSSIRVTITSLSFSLYNPFLPAPCYK